MAKFKIRAYTLDHFVHEVDAENEDESREKFLEKWESGELEVDEGTEPFFEGDEGFEHLDVFFNSLEEL